MSMTVAMTAQPAEIGRVAAEAPNVQLLGHARSCGQSAAIRTGVRAARAGWIATLDGDGQNDPADIPRLWRGGAASNGSCTGPASMGIAETGKTACRSAGLHASPTQYAAAVSEIIPRMRVAV